MRLILQMIILIKYKIYFSKLLLLKMISFKLTKKFLNLNYKLSPYLQSKIYKYLIIQFKISKFIILEVQISNKKFQIKNKIFKLEKWLRKYLSNKANLIILLKLTKEANKINKILKLTN